MAGLSLEDDLHTHNPVDLLEEIVSANEWSFERMSEHEIAVSFAGRWCDYQMHFAYAEEVSALQYTCALDMRVPKGKIAPLAELLALINGKMWIGHFDVLCDDGMPCFRQTVLLRGASGMAVEQVEDLLDIGVSECERFYPAFQFVIWGGRSPEDAVEAALLETVGEA
jgi:hypothetical protein